jgi:hypothetical protein
LSTAGTIPETLLLHAVRAAGLGLHLAITVLHHLLLQHLLLHHLLLHHLLLHHPLLQHLLLLHCSELPPGAVLTGSGNVAQALLATTSGTCSASTAGKAFRPSDRHYQNHDGDSHHSRHQTTPQFLSCESRASLPSRG